MFSVLSLRTSNLKLILKEIKNQNKSSRVFILLFHEDLAPKHSTLALILGRQDSFDTQGKKNTNCDGNVSLSLHNGDQELLFHPEVLKKTNEVPMLSLHELETLAPTLLHSCFSGVPRRYPNALPAAETPASRIQRNACLRTRRAPFRAEEKTSRAAEPDGQQAVSELELPALRRHSGRPRS